MRKEIAKTFAFLADNSCYFDVGVQNNNYNIISILIQ